MSEISILRAQFKTIKRATKVHLNSSMAAKHATVLQLAATKWGNSKANRKVEILIVTFQEPQKHMRPRNAERVKERERVEEGRETKRRLILC